MSNDDISLELETVRAMAVMKLQEIVTGLVNYGLNRDQATAILDEVVEEAMDIAYLAEQENN